MSSDVIEKLPSVPSASCHYQMFVRAVGRLKERDKLASQACKPQQRTVVIPEIIKCSPGHSY